ncbi:hypothetical protein J6590_071916 [Homalodisca vitripennis]|nr:hypothetical protein J6590_071916 [Homalodisca vitripennis]
MRTQMSLGLGDGLTLVRVIPNELGKYLSRGGTTKVSLKTEGGSESNQWLGSDKRLFSCPECALCAVTALVCLESHGAGVVRLKRSPWGLGAPLKLASGNQALDVYACSSSATTIDDDLVIDDAGAKVGSMDTDTEACVMDYNLKLPFKLRKLWPMEQKKADTIWLPDSELRRHTGKMEAVPEATAGAVSTPSGKRGRSSGSSVEKPCPTAPPERARNTNPSTEEGVGDTFREVPMIFPERRLSEVEAMELGGASSTRFSQHRVCACSSRGTSRKGGLSSCCVAMTRPEIGYRIWIQGSGSVALGDRVDGRMAGNYSATILGATKKQNAGISVSDWRVVGDVHTGDSRTWVILVDDQFSATLKGRNWRVLIGVEQVQLRARGGAADQGGQGPSDQPAAQ